MTGAWRRAAWGARRRASLEGSRAGAGATEQLSDTVNDTVSDTVGVVVRVDVLEARHHGGLAGYLRSVPDATCTSDGVRSCVAFDDREAAGWWVRVLLMKGLRDDDIVVCPRGVGPRAGD